MAPATYLLRTIDAGIAPHTVMAFSEHRTASMLRRYHIIDLEALRHAAETANNQRQLTRI